MASKRFLGLDGLRGVCALTVLLFHFNAPFQHGYLAVDVFFILSGFVIALTYEGRLRNGEQTRTFLAKRARKLFPTYWLGAVLNLTIFLWLVSTAKIDTQDSWWMLWLFIPITTLLLVPDYVTPDGVVYPAMSGVTWSLFAEWVAYFGYALIGYRWRTRALLAVAAGGWGAMAIFGYRTHLGWFVGETRGTLLTLGLLRCISGFAAGVVIYRIHTHCLFLRLPVVSTGVLLGLWLVIAMVPVHGATPTFDAATVVLFCPMLICLLIRSNHTAPKFCRQFGVLSYPLYVVHPGILYLALSTPLFGRFDEPNPVSAVLVMALCLAAAWAVARIGKILEWPIADRSPHRVPGIPEATGVLPVRGQLRERAS